MKHSKLFVVSFLVISGFVAAQSKNPLVDLKFWKKNPSIEKVQKILAEGHSLKDKGRHGRDVMSYALAAGVENRLVDF